METGENGVVVFDEEGNIIEQAAETKVATAESNVEDHEDTDERLSSTHEGDEEEEHASEGETAEDAEARRERNRSRRRESKQRRNEYIESLRREISARDEIIQRNNDRLNALERRTNGADMAMLDSEIRKCDSAYNYFKGVHAEAVSSADGKTASEAQEKLLQITTRAEQLKRLKQSVTSAQRAAPAAAPTIDPRVQRFAQDWLSRNTWYDPAGGNLDSRVTLAIDNALAEEGWNPSTKEFWEELDARVKNYLPHRVKKEHNSSRGGARPPVSGSGRESSSNSKNSSSATAGYPLSADRVQAMKDAGVWNDPVERAKAVKRYQEYDKQNGGV